MAKTNRDNHLSLMAGLPIFQNLPEASLKKLDVILTERSFSRGETIFSEGSDSDGFYIIISGRVKVYKLSTEGKEQILHLAASRELLGAVSAFAGTPYPAHAETLEKTSAFYFPRKEFLSLVQNEPALVMNMMANLALRLQHFTRLIENLSLKEVPGRLAAYLLYRCKQTGCIDSVDIDISKGQLASILGTIPETLSRILRKMTENGILEVNGRKIRLTNKQALQDILDGEKTD